MQHNIAVMWTVLAMLSAHALGYSGGTGDPNDPYQIATAQDLMALGSEPNDYEKHFVLINDIDMDPNLPGGQVFDRAIIAPDMNEVSVNFVGTAFTGSLDGQGYAIRDLTIDSTSDYAGLFGLIGVGGIVKNVYLLKGSVRGEAQFHRSGTGALAGENQGSIRDCHSDMTVMGLFYVGNLIGSNRGIVTNSSSVGSVDGTGSVGGLVGNNDNSTVLGSFWDRETSGLDVSEGGMGLTTTEMQNLNTYLDAGWDFMDIWSICEGEDYPWLQWEQRTCGEQGGE